MSGRGRGRSLFTFNVDSLGFGRGEALPSSAQAPSPLYPVRIWDSLQHSDILHMSYSDRCNVMCSFSAHAVQTGSSADGRGAGLHARS